MNILFVAPYVPSRIRVRPFHIIKELSKRHKVYVLALGEIGGAKTQGAEELLDIVEDLRVIPHSKLRGLRQSLFALPFSSPMCTAFCWSPAMKNAVRDAITGARFDVVHIEHLRAAHFASSCGSLPVVFDSVDCLSGLFTQMSRSRKNLLAKLVMFEEAWKLRRYEPRMLTQFNHIAITSESERDELISMNPALNIDVIPNGVDIDYFTPLGNDRSPRQVVFSGKMSYHPNAQAALWFARNVFPILRNRHSDAEFIIVGSDPPTEVRKLDEIPGITVTGYVQDIRPYLDRAYAAVVPMQVAVGIQNKVLEAMAMGLPVVATPIATRAFSENCPGIIEAESVEDTAKEVVKLFEHPDLAAEIGRSGREAVIRNFSWQSSVDKFESIYRKVIGKSTHDR